MRTSKCLVLAACFALAACGGGGSGSVPSTGNGATGSTGSAQSQSENAIDATNALGTPVKTVTDFETSLGTDAAIKSGMTRAIALGSCTNGYEFFAPDKNNDPNSTESEWFYDASCTQLARDSVRIYSISGTSETVNLTEKQYAIGNQSPSAQRTTSVSIISGTYDQYGFPIAADGFDRSATSELDIAGTKTILDDDELVLQPGSGGTNAYCADSAGYNATGIARLDETFGWQGGVASGTRTVNGNGSVTWQATHAGSTFKGAIGSLAINVGSANTSCPIATPEYTLTGGRQGGSYSIPVSATFILGELTNLTITNATLANGNTLNVTTNTNLQPTNQDFVTGTVSNGGTQIATFNVDTFGDGTLTITASGMQFVIDDWHVVK
jgi:hypothetical protein